MVKLKYIRSRTETSPNSLLLAFIETKKMVSAIVLSKNEEKNIESCLRSLSFCDEIILIDDYSADKTIEIAEKNNAVIFKRNLGNDFSEQRNFGLSKAKNKWVLFIDADEIVPEKLQKEIITATQRRGINGYYIPRRDFLFGKQIKHGDVENIFILRLAKKSAGKWTGQVHETWNVNGKLGKLKHEITHYPHQTITEFLSEIDFYSSIRAEELFSQKKKSGIIPILVYPKLKFINLYVLKLGFLDGLSGFVHALLMSLYSFLVRGKLYLLQNK